MSPVPRHRKDPSTHSSSSLLCYYISFGLSPSLLFDLLVAIALSIGLVSLLPSPALARSFPRDHINLKENKPPPPLRAERISKIPTAPPARPPDSLSLPVYDIYITVNGPDTRLITATMCYQVVELYSACRCLYYQHAVDRCAAYGRPGHHITKRTILVGYACSDHSRGNSYGQYASSQHTYSDSGYYSGHSSSRNSRHHR